MAAILCALVALLLAGRPAAAQGVDGAALEALSAPGTVALMRHALAPGTGDPPELTVGDCSTQRNLDERGREQARAIGAALREGGIAFDRILTSQWCRCRETAERLGLGPVEEWPALNSFFRDYSTRDEQTAAVLAMLKDLPAGERVLLVTHQVNISALTGRGTRSGEILATRLRDGALAITGGVMIAP